MAKSSLSGVPGAQCSAQSARAVASMGTTELLPPGVNWVFLQEKYNKKVGWCFSMYGKARVFSLGLNEYRYLF